MNPFNPSDMSLKITIPTDKNGLTGRECPIAECQGYFKIRNGIGLMGKDLPCHCPYCGHTDSHSRFFTKEQNEYIQSVVMNSVSNSLLNALKPMERSIRSRGMIGIGIDIKINGKPHPIRFYREKQLETDLKCEGCGLHYAIYGVFASCPDCGIHNSFQILKKNMELISKQLAIAETVEAEFSRFLISDALENVVSAFDGFAREVSRVNASISTDPEQIKYLSFQNLEKCNTRMKELFDIDLAEGLQLEEWTFICRCFNKRHLLAHTMGIVDEAYMAATQDPTATVGRRITILVDEVKRVSHLLCQIGLNLIRACEKRSGGRSS